MVRVIGLTGGIASGKSTVANILRELGAFIIDADRIAKKVVEKGKPALNKIEKYFGTEILFQNGELDRKKLGSIVFNDATLLERLNEITHPYIIKEIIDEINWYKRVYDSHVIILDAALLIEMELTYLVDEVWLVALPEEMQITRLIEREAISLDGARMRINAQMPLKYKKQYAHRIIDNSRDLAYLTTQVNEIWGKIIE